MPPLLTATTKTPAPPLPRRPWHMLEVPTTFPNHRRPIHRRGQTRHERLGHRPAPMPKPVRLNRPPAPPLPPMTCRVQEESVAEAVAEQARSDAARTPARRKRARSWTKPPGDRLPDEPLTAPGTHQRKRTARTMPMPRAAAASDDLARQRERSPLDDL
ncbi:MAG: hypothetical protein WKG07_12980 [Hymenobacter sp.]